MERVRLRASLLREGSELSGKLQAATGVDRAAPAPSDGARPIQLDAGDARWRAFVSSHPAAQPFHHPAWSALLTECYGYRPFAVALADPTGAVLAGLPVLEVRSVIGRPRWISLPFTDYCPPLTSGGAGEAELAVALGAAADEAGVGRVEVHAPISGPAAALAVKAVRHTLPLALDPEAAFATFSRSQVQRNIARAEREGVAVRRGDSEADLSAVFYELHVRTRRRQGVPVQPRRFFELLWRRLIEPELGFVLLAYAGKMPVAGAVFLAWNGTLIYKFGASRPDFWKLRPNHLLFWSAIRWGCENGHHTLDFGRTNLDNEGLRRFKDSWGTREEPLAYSVLGGRALPLSSGVASRGLAAVIRRSPPWVCRLAGTALYRYAA